MKKSFNKIIKAAENLDWTVTDSRKCGCIVEDGMTQLEFGKYSPEGEDFSFTVESDCPEGMVDEINAYSSEFDIDEHIAMWINAKQSGTGGIPSIKALVKDADDIKEMIQELAEAVSCSVLSRSR